MKPSFIPFLIVYVTIITITIHSVSAAKIYGKVYDIELNEIDNVVVNINTSPEQTFVSKNGSYYFIVPFGDYVLSAKRVVNGIIQESVTENITINKDGDYVIDLILFPEFDDEYLDDINFDVSIPSEKNGLKAELLFFVIIIFLIIISVMIILYIKNKRKKGEMNNTISETSGSLADKIFEEIKKNDGRITQKELRRKFPYSEAKISLVVSELEGKGVIEKIKKGRGNILVIKK